MASYILTLVILFLLFSYLNVIIHEIGHAVIGHSAGFVVNSFGTGTGRPLCVVPLGRVRMYFCMIRPLQGLTFAFHPELLVSRGKLALFCAGGVLFNLLFALIFLGLGLGLNWGREVWLMGAATNLFALTSLLPVKISMGKVKLPTDGLLILNAFRSGTVETQAPMALQVVESFRGLWLSIGDHTTLMVNLLGAAEACVHLGDLERADTYLAEADSLAESSSPSAQAIPEITRASIESSRERFDEATEALDAAEARFRSEGRKVGLWLVSMSRTSVLLNRGELSDAAAALSELATAPFLNSHPPLRVALVAQRVFLAIRQGNPDEVKRLAEAYEPWRKRIPSTSRDLLVDKALAHFWTGLGDRVEAESAYRRTLASIGTLAEAWIKPEDRIRFLDHQSAVLDEARSCLEENGKGEEAERLISPSQSTPMEVQSRDDQAFASRERRRLRIGHRMTLLNLVVMLVAIAMERWSDGGPKQSSFFFGIGLYFAVCNFVAVMLMLAGFLQRRFQPHARSNWSTLILGAACLAWVSAIALWVMGTPAPRPM